MNADAAPAVDDLLNSQNVSAVATVFDRYLQVDRLRAPFSKVI